MGIPFFENKMRYAVVGFIYLWDECRMYFGKTTIMLLIPVFALSFATSFGYVDAANKMKICNENSRGDLWQHYNAWDFFGYDQLYTMKYRNKYFKWGS